jgi:hypothetical protein
MVTNVKFLEEVNVLDHDFFFLNNALQILNRIEKSGSCS